MSTSRNENDALNSLLGDVLSADDVTPEQLLQYVEQPNTLTAEERTSIELRIAESPELADQLRVLQNFGVPAVRSAPVIASKPHRAATPNFLQQFMQTVNEWISGSWVPAGAMAIIALAITVAVLLSRPDAPVPQIAQDDTPVDVTPDPQQSVKDEQLVAQTDPQQEIPEQQPDTVEDHRSEREKETLMLAMQNPLYVSGYEIGPNMAIRGENDEISCLAPAIADSASAQPNLYWSISEIPAKAKFLVEIVNDESGELLLSKTLKKPAAPGIQEISLEELNVMLNNDSVYQWTVTMQIDPDNPALDKFASARIKYVVPIDEFAIEVDAAPVSEKTNLYARNGYWYDAFSHMISLQRQYPDNTSVQQAYESLISQGVNNK